MPLPTVGWWWSCVDCGSQGRLKRSWTAVGDTEDYARLRAARIHLRRCKAGKLACRDSSGCIRVDAIPDQFEMIRNDATKTAARYDEIIELRMLAMDLVDSVEDRGLDDCSVPLASFTRRLKERAKKWGKKGDCV